MLLQSMHHGKNIVKSFVKSNMHKLCPAKNIQNNGKISRECSAEQK